MDHITSEISVSVFSIRSIMLYGTLVCGVRDPAESNPTSAIPCLS